MSKRQPYTPFSREIDGKTYQGSYVYENGVVTVWALDQSKSAKIIGTSIEVTAGQLLHEIVNTTARISRISDHAQ
jgi:hypothetical protein